MAVLAELEFRIGGRSPGKTGYPITPQLSINGQDMVFPEEEIALDPDELFLLRGEQDRYNARLSEVFFGARHVREALLQAQAQLDQAGPGFALRVRLMIQPEAKELHRVHWECLRDSDGRPLFHGDLILFSRYLPSSHLRPLTVRTGLKALVAIANPPHLDQAINPEDLANGLAPVDVVNEKLRAEAGLKNAGFSVTTLAAPPVGTASATLANIVQELAKGYDIFHLVCHGGLVPAGDGIKPMLWLEDGEDPIEAERLVEEIREMEHQPRLVILASCQSAGTDGASVAASGSLAALGPLLAEAGVPAVVAMQGNIRMKTVEAFLPQFFSELAKDGQIDRAMGRARGHARDLDCPDYWMPTLFMRLSTGSIWPEHSKKAEPQEETQAIVSDRSKPFQFLPLDPAFVAEACPGEVRPSEPGIWNTVASAPNLLPYAMFRSFGAGRILALGHERLILQQDRAGRNSLMESGVIWLRGSRSARVLVSSKKTDTLQIFAGQEFNFPLVRSLFFRWQFSIETADVLDNPAMLARAGILLIGNAWGAFTVPEKNAILEFVKSGGGLLGAGLGWSWQRYGPRGKVNPSPKPLKDYPMNQLFEPFGASWTELPATTV